MGHIKNIKNVSACLITFSKDGLCHFLFFYADVCSSAHFPDLFVLYLLFNNIKRGLYRGSTTRAKGHYQRKRAAPVFRDILASFLYSGRKQRCVVHSFYSLCSNPYAGKGFRGANLQCIRYGQSHDSWAKVLPSHDGEEGCEGHNAVSYELKTHCQPTTCAHTQTHTHT